MSSRQIARSASRRYRMSQRAAGINKTRQRIVQSAVRLHGKQGITETSWAAIGKTARVSTATVYRHFPTLDSLIPACAQATFAAGAGLPTAQEIAHQFIGLTDTKERLRRLITDSCRCYERGEGWLDACRHEAHKVPALSDAVRAQDRTLDALIAAAVGPRIAHHRRAAMKSLLDFPFWKALIDAGIPRAKAPTIIADLAFGLVEPQRR
jgi:AcrR family transcriptional regulator